MLHIHYDFSCLFNCPCISSLIFIFSPLRLHQTLTASLWRPVTPKDGVSGVLWLLLISPLPPILSLSECQARRTVDRICNKLEHCQALNRNQNTFIPLPFIAPVRLGWSCQPWCCKQSIWRTKLEPVPHKFRFFFLSAPATVIWVLENTFSCAVKVLRHFH